LKSLGTTEICQLIYFAVKNALWGCHNVVGILFSMMVSWTLIGQQSFALKG
jgi:hypothetical protein